MSMAGFRSKTCENCGRYFMDDCNDAFCSSSCENEYNRGHVECERCGYEYHEDDLNSNNICESCEEELEDEE
jgi:hypothetical protein